MSNGTTKWRKYLRELKLQNPVTGKPTASTEQKIAQAALLEVREDLLSKIGEIKRKDERLMLSRSLPM